MLLTVVKLLLMNLKMRIAVLFSFERKIHSKNCIDQRNQWTYLRELSLLLVNVGRLESLMVVSFINSWIWIT